MANQFGARNYHPLSVVLTKGEGAKVWDVNGKEYTDLLACYSALNFGHQHPVLVEALKAQVGKLAVCSRAFYSEELCLFSKELSEFCELDSVLPMNSGTEAVETAIKVVRKWGYQKKKVEKNKANIIVAENNFHGRSVAIVSFSSEQNYREGFGPFVPGFKLVPFNDVKSIENAIDENTVGVLMEPIQAEAGILIPQAGYLQDLRDLCTSRGVLLIWDEIQTGLARTGKNFCYEYEKAKPDVLILGKSLGGGMLPISAVIAKGEVMDVIRPGQHGSTFGGNPLACAVARETLKLMKRENFSQKAEKIGALVKEGLTRFKSPHIKEVRGKGALIGIELFESAGGARKYTEKLAEKGILCKETHDHVIRIAPPLVIKEADLKAALHSIREVLQ